jgi:hypothetical protein
VFRHAPMNEHELNNYDYRKNTNCNCSG